MPFPIVRKEIILLQFALDCVVELLMQAIVQSIVKALIGELNIAVEDKGACFEIRHLFQINRIKEFAYLLRKIRVINIQGAILQAHQAKTEFASGELFGVGNASQFTRIHKSTDQQTAQEFFLLLTRFHAYTSFHLF